jgi:hypothetical protein
LCISAQYICPACSTKLCISAQYICSACSTKLCTPAQHRCLACSTNLCILVWSIVGFRRVCCKLLSNGRKWVATWRTTARGLVPGPGDTRGPACLSVMTLLVRPVTTWF